MSNLPPGCTMDDLDRSLGWKPRSECTDDFDRWEWDNEWGKGAEMTPEAFRALLSLPRERRIKAMDAYDIVDLYDEAHRG